MQTPPPSSLTPPPPSRPSRARSFTRTLNHPFALRSRSAVRHRFCHSPMSCSALSIYSHLLSLWRQNPDKHEYPDPCEVADWVESDGSEIQDSMQLYSSRPCRRRRRRLGTTLPYVLPMSYPRSRRSQLSDIADKKMPSKCLPCHS